MGRTPYARRASVYERIVGEWSVPFVKYLKSDHSWKVRIFALSVFLVLLAITVYQCYTLIAYYFSYPITVVITEIEKDNGTFPALVICPPGQFRASRLADRMPNVTHRMNFARDIREMESNRKEIIKVFGEKNITFDEAFIEEKIKELQNISDSFRVADDKDKKEIYERITSISRSLSKFFPYMAAQLNVTEPVEKGLLFLNNKSSEEPLGSFDRFRELNDKYNSSVHRCDWRNKNLPPYSKKTCKDPEQDLDSGYISGGVIADLQFIQRYAEMIHLLRPTRNDIILECKWIGKNCTISEVWTPHGLCFRIVPEDPNGFTVTRVGDDMDISVNILIDTLTHEFRNKSSKVFFYSQDETEFAHYSGGIVVKPGLVSQMSITQTRQTFRADQNCGTLELDHFQNYTKEKCKWERRTANIESKCSCLSDKEPDYWDESIAEMDGMRSNETNITLCSFVDSLFCVPGAIEKQIDCPNSCDEFAYEVDMNTYPFDEALLASRIFRRERDFTTAVDRVSQYGLFRTVPGGKKLDILLDRFFRQHLQMLKTFWWWNNTAPYYNVWIPSWDEGLLKRYYNCNSRARGFEACAMKTTMPCIGSHINEELFFVSNETYSHFIDILNETLTMYAQYNSGWKNDYIKEAILPFGREIELNIADAEKHKDSINTMKSLILQKLKSCFKPCVFNSNCSNDEWLDMIEVNEDILEDNDIDIHSYLTDPSLADQWALKCIQQLNGTLQTYAEINEPAANINKLMASLVDRPDEKSPSCWEKPFSVYLKWLHSELNVANIFSPRSRTLARTLTFHGYILDVSTAASSYAAETEKRDNLREALVSVSAELRTLRNRLLEIYIALNAVNYPADDELYLNNTIPYTSILYRGFKHNDTLDEMLHCYNNTATTVDSFVSSNGIFQLSEYDERRTIWYINFTQFIDTRLHSFTDGADYHKASLAEINVFFRSFRQRTIEEQEAYGFWSMLSEVGGAIGLWLGAAVLTLFELIILGLSPKFVLAHASASGSRISDP